MIINTGRHDADHFQCQKNIEFILPEFTDCNGELLPISVQGIKVDVVSGKWSAPYRIHAETIFNEFGGETNLSCDHRFLVAEDLEIYKSIDINSGWDVDGTGYPYVLLTLKDCVESSNRYQWEESLDCSHAKLSLKELFLKKFDEQISSLIEDEHSWSNQVLCQNFKAALETARDSELEKLLLGDHNDIECDG